MDNKKAAQALYNEGWKQKDIARFLGVTEKTCSSWKIAGKWDEKLANDSNMRDTAADNIMRLVNYQLRVLNKIKDIHDVTLDTMDDLSSLNKALIENGQIDALYKMFHAVKGKEMTWSGYVKIIRELHEYLSEHNMEMAKSLSELSDDFLNAKRKEFK